MSQHHQPTERSVTSARSVMMPIDSHNRLPRTPRMRPQAFLIIQIRRVSHNPDPLQLLEDSRHSAPVRTPAVVLVRRHPLIISLPPFPIHFSLRIWVHAILFCKLGVPPRGVVGGLKVDDALKTVLVLVAEVQNAAAVAAALRTRVGSHRACLRKAPLHS